MLNNNSNGNNFKKRVVFTTGGKGGVGKTGVSLAIADWYNARQIPFLPLDLDTENKALGSLRHYFPEAQKVDVHTDAGLDIFISVLATWASNLEDRVHYLIVENSNTSNPDFTYWQQSKQARAFRDTLNPTIIPMEFRLPELERIARQYGVTLRAIGSRSAGVANQLQIAHVIRAQRYTQRFAAHFDRA